MSEENKGGRPSIFSSELALTICERIANGESLREICKPDDMPNRSTVFRWLLSDAEEHRAFRDQYNQAVEMRTEGWAEEILDIADDATNDWMRRNGGDEDSQPVVNGDHISRSRLRVDSRKWLMSKMLPKKYGDKITQEHTGGDKPIETIQHIELVPVEPVGVDSKN